MKNSKKIILLLILVIGFACGLKFWADNSPVVADYNSIHTRDTEIDLAAAFTTALRTNHPDAYAMIDPGLKPRLDKWMDTHQSKKCAYPADVFFVGSGTGSRTIFGCYGHDGWISFEIDNIIIKDMKIIDRGQTREGD